jgi:hypothetical protein
MWCIMEVGDLPQGESTAKMNTSVVDGTWLLSVCFQMYLTILFKCTRVSHKYRENVKLLTDKFVDIRDCVRFYGATRALSIDIILLPSELSEHMK